MNRKTLSMRGEVVDFDLFAIKEQMGSAPSTEEIKQRENFISVRRKRGHRRKLQDMVAEHTAREAAEQEVVEVAEEDEAPAGRKVKR